VSEFVVATMTSARPRLSAPGRQVGSWSVRATTASDSAWFSLRTESTAGVIASADLDLSARITDIHLRSRVDSRGHDGWCSSSDVLYHARPEVCATEVVETLRAHPGAAVCLAWNGLHDLTIAIRWHAGISVLRGDVSLAFGAESTAAFGSAVHAWIAAGLSPHLLTGLALGREQVRRLACVAFRYVTDS